ncbi:polyketide cyclase / dehydrase and lipid transport [Mycobacterium sp. E2462]|uniref:SRPBCC family protein n=1 Tax=Mycobacterium sp. E2462 TaxID=1834133 RepID=UPI0007FBDAE6|nr:SRPBCC family protein [Mycobacterium sp. E2462]OBI09122.1 polyketide cyclase / dehydrase and lipid transport [Mycobacterium sp. E2462]
MSWWLAQSEHTLTQRVPARPEEVRDFYVDLDSLALLHPLIVSVETLARSRTDDGYLHSYRVRDRIALGPLTVGITYRARLRVPAVCDVRTEADQFPGVRLRGTVRFEPDPAGARVTERIQIAAPRPLAGVTARQAVKAHREMLAGLAARFAGRS